MNIYAILPLVNVFLLVSAGIYLVSKRKKTVFYPLFGLSCLLLSLVEFSNFRVFISAHVIQALFWQRFAMACILLLPVCWSLLGLVFARKNYQASIKKRLWYLIALFALGLWFMSFITKESFISEAQILFNGFGFLLGPVGRYAFVFLLISFIVTLLDFENTYSSSKGVQKPGIKSAIRGISIPIGAYFILTSFVILFSYIDSRFTAVSSIAIILSFLLITRSIFKYGLVDSNIQVGRQAVYTSGALIIMGIYLILVGVIAKIFMKAGVNLTSFLSFLGAFFVFFLFVSLIFSGSLKERLRFFIDRSFYKDKYDYRREWTNLSERLGTILNINELITEVKNIVEQLLGVQSTEVVLEDNHTELLEWLLRFGEPISTEEFCRNNPTLYEENRELLEKLEAHILVSLNAKHKILGMLVVGKKDNAKEFSSEDTELLKIISRQISIAILNSKLSEELVISREMEHFHKISTFLIHDLKNCVSMLSMISQNAANNFDKPEFQKDSLTTISSTISKMNNLMNKLSTLPKKLELDLKPQNVNVLIDEIIAKSRIEDIQAIKLMRLLNQVPNLKIDAEYIQKVILNLVLNALEAMPEGGNLMIKTELEEGVAAANKMYVQIMVGDTGSGMSDEFIRQRLFKPFQSGKHKGLGIGLFQCKTIVEAHEGEILVESEEGKGTKFTVRIPVK